ncbi:MAG: TadE/TadG family type IV pilus assembly protein [Terracidiphilus sp.]
MKRILQTRRCERSFLRICGLLRKLGHCGDCGGALIETALAAPLLSLLLLGAAEFGMVDYAAIEVTNAAKAGADYGASSLTAAADTTGIQTAARNDAANITLGTTTVGRSYICSDGTSPTGTFPTLICTTGTALETILIVQTQTSFTPLIHIPGFTSPFTLHGYASQKVTQ